MKWGVLAPENGQSVRGPPPTFLESQNAHAPGVSGLPLSKREASPEKIGPFLGAKIVKWGVFAPENGQSVRAPPLTFLESQNSHAPGVSGLPL